MCFEVIEVDENKVSAFENREILPLKYQSNYAVIQANELVRSRQDDLSLLEAKLIRLAVAQVLKDDIDLKTYKISVSKLASYLNISSPNIYRDIQDLSLSIMKKRIFIKAKEKKKNGKPDYKIFHWVEAIEYKDGTIIFELSEKLKPYLVGLNELFSSYRFEEILQLTSSNAIRLYELLVSYANIRFRDYYNDRFTYNDIELDNDEVIFTMDELREFFNCKDEKTGEIIKYPNGSDFIRRIIDAGVKEINTYTVLPCSYRIIKQGRKIEYVVFKIGDWQSSAGQMVLDSFLNKQRKKQNRGKK